MAKANSKTGNAKTSNITMSSLRKWNIVAGFAHLIQMILILVLANAFALPVTATYVAGPPGTPPSAPVTLFEIRTAYAIAIFFGLSALFHFIVAFPPFNARYDRGLTQGHNYFRWVEYSLSSSVMIVLIAQLLGIFDVGALVAIFGVNASMILFGWLQERFTKPGETLIAFWFGCIAGLVPWLIFLIFIIAPKSPNPVEIPGFVWGIVISLFLLFNSFAIVQYLQYKPVGKWSNYLRGERAYIILSLTAKSALAWQIFAGTLVPAN